MIGKDNSTVDVGNLRRQAEKIAREKAAQSPEDIESLSPDEIRQILHELRVHQIELEMQNEELRLAQVKMDAARARYFNLYDLAPVGYCTLSEKGLILEGNLTAANLLGVVRSALIKQPITRFIYKEDQDIYYLHRKQLFETSETQTCELRMVKQDGKTFWAHLEATAAQDADSVTVCRVMISDISRRKRIDALLLESEKRFSTLATLAPAGIYLCNSKGHCQYVNPRWCEMTGLSLEEALGNGWAKGLHPEDRESVFSNWRQMVASGSQWGLEFRFQTPAGKVTWVHGLAAPQRNALGNVVAYVGISTDITERKQADALLEESEARYRQLFEKAPAGIYEVDLTTGRMLSVNDSMCEYTGYTKDELLTMNTLDLLTEESQKIFIERMAGYAAGKPVTANLEFKARSKSGCEFWISINPKYFYEEGIPVRASVVAQDITERKQAEESLQESETRMRTLVRTVPDLVWLKDPEGIYLFCNSKFESFLDKKETDIIGKTDYDFVDKQLADSFRERDKIAMTKGMPIKFEEDVIFADDGHREILETIKTPMFSSDGQLAGVLGIGRNITERVNLQAQLIQAQKMESVGQLAGGVAHDYNNALSVIIGFTELAMEKIDPAGPLHADLTEVLNAANHATDITRQLLAFARKQIVAPVVLDLNDNIETMLKMLRRLIGEDIDLAWLPGTSLWPVKMDPSQIDQILANLCVNARDVLAGVGKVTIETMNKVFDAAYCADHAGFIPGEFVLMAVSDNGCGMDKEILDNIFEPFFTTKDVGKGTGLGLATVYGIVKQNNGFINVYSEPGKGTTIKIYLPRHEGEAAEIQGESTVEIPSGLGETILVVEDDLPILKLTHKILDELGYTVLTATTPSEALSLTEEHAGRIHLLVTDVIMPEMNGHDLANRLLFLCPELKCVFMSGYTRNAIAHHGVLDKGVNFVQKPFSKRELAKTVRKVLDEGKNFNA